MIDKMLDKLLEASVLVALAAILYLVSLLHDFLKKKRANITEVREKNDNDLRINEQLSHLRWALNAQRAYYSKFHNGEYFKDFSDALKKTRTHEAVRDGVAYQAEHFKGMLISTVPDEIRLVLEDGASYTRIRDLPSGKFKWMLVNGGVEAVARCGVQDPRGNITGFIGVDFDHEEPPTEEQLKLICETAGRIGLLK